MLRLFFSRTVPRRQPKRFITYDALGFPKDSISPFEPVDPPEVKTPKEKEKPDPKNTTINPEPEVTTNFTP